jgi:mRNA interferase RelE/StbE
LADYNIEFVASAAKEFRSLPTEIKHRVASAVETLRKDPHQTGARKLHGHKMLYRIRVGQYRIVYEMHDERKVIRITRVRHRREVYR